MKCEKCGKDFTDIKKYIFHLEYFHKVTNYYKCTMDNCHRLFHRKDRFKSHVVAKHSLQRTERVFSQNKSSNNNILDSVTDNNQNEGTPRPSFIDNNNYHDSDCIKDNLEKFKVILEQAAKSFISKLYDSPEISRTIVQLIIDSLSAFLSSELIHVIKESLANLFKSSRTTMPSELQYIFQMLDKLSSSFSELNTEYKRFKYFESNNTLLKPSPHIIGVRNEQKRRNGDTLLDLQNALAYHIPMGKTLKLFFEIPGVFDTIHNFYLTLLEDSNSDSMSNVVHGRIWQNIRKRFSFNEIVFPLLLYFDDFETLNPLGSHAGCYKIGALYFTVPCVPPEFASRLENIFLTEIFYSKDRSEFGNKRVFEPIIKELEDLATKGINIQIQSKLYNIKFCLLTLCGDNLGLHSILGLNETFSSTYCCRFCIENKDSIKHKTLETLTSIRKKEDYEDHLTRNIGVKDRCVWNDLPTFHIYENLSCDIMHDIYEGVLRYDMAVIIKALIDQKKFTLTNLNSRIKYFNYEMTEKNIPPSINHEHLVKGCIIMSSAEMLCLCQNFRFIVGDLVPDDNEVWLYYLLVFELVNTLNSQTMSFKSLEFISNLVQEHNEFYLKFSHEHLKPKFHWLLHYHRIIREIGPPKLLSCMRFEAKHKEFKNIADNIRCRKNLPLSLALKMQLKICHRLNAQRGFPDKIHFGIVGEISIKYSKYFEEANLNITNFFHSNWYEINGTYYNNKSIVIIDISDDIPTFFSVLDIYIEEGKSRSVYFFGVLLETIGHSYHYCSYKVVKTNTYKLYSRDTLFSKTPTIMRNIEDTYYVSLK